MTPLLPDERKAERAQLCKDVRLMRALGVVRWRRGDEEIFLGPPPEPTVPARERTPEEEREHREREAKRRHETLFAASSTRPLLPEQDKDQRATVLKSVVPRQPPQEHDSGPPNDE